MDLAARKRRIAGSVFWTVPGTIGLSAAAYALLPPLSTPVDAQAARVHLALRWLAVAALPYVAVCITIMSARFFAGAHNPVVDDEPERLRIHCRVMQNTLEQLVWFAVGLLAVATFVDAQQAKIIPIASVAFVVGRLVFWRGYLQPGTLGRAPGVQITACVNVHLLAAALLLLARSVF
jgi:hypothetical protein